jgi:adenosine deaminase
MPERNLAELPKAHLHLHFTGSMRPGTLADLAAKHGIRLPETLREHHLLRLTPDERGWFRFQRLYDAAEGSGWLELQVDPTSYAPFVGGLTPALEVVLDAAREASRRTSCGVAVIVAASRIRHPLDARTLARLAVRYAGEGPGDVVGFGLSNDERRGSTEEFAKAFAIAERAGLAAVPHSGELLGPDSIRVALDALHPDRLGHGVRSAEDPVLLERIVRSGIGLEVCPASNVALGVYRTAADVPLRRLVDAGARIALGADDPLLFGPRLDAQYRIARDVQGFTDAELAALARSSIEMSRAPLDVRKRLLAGVDDWLAQ